MTPLSQTSTINTTRVDQDTGANPVAPSRPAESSIKSNREAMGSRLLGFLALLGVTSLLIYGWVYRASSTIHAESGLGYILGIAGGSSMLLLLLYPLRKKSRLLARLGKIRYWFRTHMILGVTGPVLILFHCNFQLGSINSNVALFSMLLVAGSGLVGRFLYRRIHNGLYGQKANLAELRRSLQYRKEVLSTHFTLSPSIAQQLLVLEQNALRSKNPLFHILTLPLNALYMFFAHRQLRQQVKQDLKQQSVEENWGKETHRLARKQASSMVKAYIKTVQKAADLSAYERLFSLWHFLHMPFFIMLLLSGIIHVVAVHMY